MGGANGRGIGGLGTSGGSRRLAESMGGVGAIRGDKQGPQGRSGRWREQMESTGDTGRIGGQQSPQGESVRSEGQARSVRKLKGLGDKQGLWVGLGGKWGFPGVGGVQERLVGSGAVLGSTGLPATGRSCCGSSCGGLFGILKMGITSPAPTLL